MKRPACVVYASVFGVGRVGDIKPQRLLPDVAYCICTNSTTSGMFQHKRLQAQQFLCSQMHKLDKKKEKKGGENHEGRKRRPWVLLKQFPFSPTPKRSITDQMILPGACGSPARGFAAPLAPYPTPPPQIQHSWL